MEEHSQDWLCHLEGNILVGDFGAAGGVASAAAAAVRIVGGRGVAFHVVAAGASCAATAARGSALGAATKHAEVGGNNLRGCPLLAFFVLPFARLNAAFEIEERSEEHTSELQS